MMRTMVQNATLQNCLTVILQQRFLAGGGVSADCYRKNGGTWCPKIGSHLHRYFGGAVTTIVSVFKTQFATSLGSI